MGNTTSYTLGSGHLHIQAFTNSTLPDNWDTFFNSTSNILGRIKGGASFEYSTEKTEDEDDLGYIKICEVTKENVVLTSGMMTWDADTLAKLCQTARSTTGADGMVTTKIGGLGNQTDTVWVLGFEHRSKGLRVIIVGKNNEGFTFDFKQDAATVIDCKFKAEASDSDGTLIIIQDLRKAPVAESVTIGSLALSPAFNKYTKTYTAATSNATNNITVVAPTGVVATIKNGETTVTSGSAATWTTGENTVTVDCEDTNGKKFTYTITVTKS
jgi:hypothetical protein